MRCICDENIPLAAELFSRIGEVVTMPGRAICRESLDGAEILAVRSVTKVDKSLLEKSPVRMVLTATIGFDHVDRDYLQTAGIRFASAPGSNADSVAQYVVAALSVCARDRGWKLGSRTVGIVGAGNVGTRVHRLCTALGMRCLLSDPPLEQASDPRSLYALETLIEQCDVLTFHVPLTRSGPYATQYLGSGNVLDRMKPGSILINTSRGGVVDERALLGLRNTFEAVILDVWEGEPNPAVDTIAAATIATPHIAGYSYDGKIRGSWMIYEAACRFLDIETGPAPDVRPESPLSVDLSHSSNPVIDAILGAYDIMADDRRFRAITGFSAVERSAYFDTCRKTYPIRREFPCWGVEHTVKESGVLKDLGFIVKQKR